MGKSFIGRIPMNHFATLKNSKGKPSIRDFLFQLGVPAICGIVILFLGYSICDPSPIITGVSIAAALMGAIEVLVFQIRLTLRDDARLDKYDYNLVDELFSNIAWGIVVGFLLTLVLVAISFLDEVVRVSVIGITASALVVTLGAHFVIVIAMCVKRLVRCYERIAARKA